MSLLERDYPEWYEFLLWHESCCRELYLGNGMAHAYVELTSRARDYVCRSIRQGY